MSIGIKMPLLGFKFLSSLAPSPRNSTHSSPFLLILLSPLSSLSKTPNPLFTHFLVNSLHFSPSQALSIASSSRFSNLKSLHKPQAVLLYLSHLGFSQTHIHSLVRSCPGYLLSDVDKTLKPKIEYFQKLGLPSSQLGSFFSRTPVVLRTSLHKRLIPTINFLRKILGNNEDLFTVLRKSSWFLCYSLNSRLLPNVRFLQSCGIVGIQLAFLLKTHPRLIVMLESSLRNVVSRVSDLGFKMNSRMFVYAVISVGCHRVETVERKVKTFERFGFSKDEYMEMFRKCPLLLCCSSEKSIIGLDFYLDRVELSKEVIMGDPKMLMYSMEKRVKPRCNVVQLLMSKQLLKRKPSISQVLCMKEEVFLRRYIYKFKDNRKELLKAYKGHDLESSSKDHSVKNVIHVNAVF